MKSNSGSKSDSSDDEYEDLASYVNGFYGSKIEEKQLAQGATVNKKPANDMATKRQKSLEKVFDDNVLIAKKAPFWWSFFCFCLDDGVVVDVQIQDSETDKVTKSALLANLLNETDNEGFLK